MKKWIFILGLLLLIGGNNCWATAIVQTTDYISFPVVALDSVTGVECVPESVHIHVWRGSLTNTTVYSFRETGDGADLAQIDSVATGYAGAVPQQYYFHDQVQDIDGDGTAGVYTINVRLWRGTTPTSNWFSFQVVDSSFNFGVMHIGEIEDEIAVVDGNVDNIVLYTDGDGSDGIDADLATVDGNVDNIVLYTDGDDSDGIDADIATVKAKTDNLPSDPADQSLIMAEVGNLDNWNPITDNDSLIIDRSTTLYITGTPDVNAIQISGDATAANNAELFFDGTGYAGTNNVIPTVTTVSNEVTADMVKISGDATAANNLETMLDGTGGQKLSLGQLHIIQSGGGASGDYALQVKASGESDAVYIEAGQTSGTGVYVLTTDGDAVYLDRSGSHYDINLAGSGTIHGTIDSCAGPAYVIAIADTANAILDSIQAHAPHGDNWAAGTGVSAIADTVNAILDTIQAHAPHGNDWGQGAGSLTAITDTVNAILDTLQNQDDWVASSSNQTLIIDTVNATLDTIQAHAPHGDNWGSCVSPGARTVVIQCLDYTDSTTGISGVWIDVYDSTAGEYKANLITNTSGLCTLSLDDATYTVHLKKTADAIDGGSPKYPIISSDTTLTYYIDQFDPGAPPSADMCRVWCIAYDLENNEVAGARLTIQVPGRFMPLVYDGTPVSRYTRSAVSNDTGYVHIDIYEMEGTNRIKCEADTSLTVKANIELRFPTGEVIRTYKAIPDATDWEVEW